MWLKTTVTVKMTLHMGKKEVKFCEREGPSFAFWGFHLKLVLKREKSQKEPLTLSFLCSRDANAKTCSRKGVWGAHPV